MFSGFNPDRVQYLAVTGSIALLLFIMELIRRKWLRENYSLLWLTMGVLFLLFSFWRRGLELLAQAMGISYPPAAFLLILVMAIFLILIQFSIITSDLTNRNRRLTQEVGLLKQRLEALEQKDDPARGGHAGG